METRVTELEADARKAQARYEEMIEKGTKSGIIDQGKFKIAGVGSTLLSRRFSACQPHILYNIKTQSVLYIHIDPIDSWPPPACYENTISNLRRDYEKTGEKYTDKDEAAKKFFADGDIIHFQVIYTGGGVAVSNSKPHTNGEERVRKLLRCLNPVNDTEHKEVPTCSRKITTQHIYVGQTYDTQLATLAVNITSTGLEFHALVSGMIGEPAPTDAGVLHTKTQKAGSRTYHFVIRQINISSDGKNVSQLTNEDKLQPVPLSFQARKEQKAATTIQQAWRKQHTQENKQERAKRIADAKVGAGSITNGSSLFSTSQSNQNLSLSTPLFATEEDGSTSKLGKFCKDLGACVDSLSRKFRKH